MCSVLLQRCTGKGEISSSEGIWKFYKASLLYTACNTHEVQGDQVTDTRGWRDREIAGDTLVPDTTGRGKKKKKRKENKSPK